MELLKEVCVCVCVSEIAEEECVACHPQTRELVVQFCNTLEAAEAQSEPFLRLQ